VATPERHAANVLNAQKSTGPRTAAGKAKSAGNARRHGLSARGAADLGAEDFLADLFADWPEDFGWDNFTILEALASTQARLARAGELEALAVEEIADAAPTLGLQEVEQDRRRTTARSCMGRALAAGSRPVGPYGAEDFRLMAGVFRAAGQSEPKFSQALERLRKLSRHTRDAEALRRKLVKALAAAARDNSPELD
jgi:hypothetical protein